MSHDLIFSLAFEQSTDCLFLLENGKFIDCNLTAVKSLGCTDRSQIIGRQPSDFSPEYQPDGTRSEISEQTLINLAVEQGSYCFEWVHQRLDGQLLPVEILLTAITYQGRYILYANWRDISRRRMAEEALAYRRELESHITHTSSYFINLPTEKIDTGIHQVLGDLGRFVKADRSYVFVYENDLMHNRYEWCANGIEPQINRMQGVPVHALQWSNSQIMQGLTLNIPSVEQLPPEAQAEKNEFAAQGIKSVLVVPMERRGQIVGFIGFDAVRQPRQWSKEIVDTLLIGAGIIANVLDRRDAESKLRESNATLEQRVEARTRELEERRRVAESLRGTLAVINSRSTLDETLFHLVTQAKNLTHASACVLYSINHTTQTGKVEVGVGLLEDEADHLVFDLNTTPGLELMDIVSQRKALAVNFDKSTLNEVRTDKNANPLIREKRAEVVEKFSASLSIPLIVRDLPYGAMLLYYEQPQNFSEQQRRTAMILAEQAALAIENARLHQAEQERRSEAEQRRRIAEGLREGLMVLNSSLSLDDILDFIIRQATQLLDTDGGALYLLNHKRTMLHVGASYGLDASYTTLPLPLGGAITGRAVALGEPVSVPDIKAAAALLDSYLREPNIPSGWIEALSQLKANYNAVLSVPVRTREQTYGAITLYYPERQQFTDDVIGLAVAFAGQAALVIENAQLRERARETAAIEERNRLARDLHDAVTQTLFSASLIADTLPELWQIDPLDAQYQIERIGQLTRGALAEMRTLLIELRPARLVEADINSLLQQLIDATQGRSNVDIKLNIQGQCDLPPDTKIVFYRVAQEALNNIIKHARADHVYVSMRCVADQINLKILDDGSGFDRNAIAPGHFGIQIMRERAASIRATFIVDTSPGEGTEIQMIWRAKNE